MTEEKYQLVKDSYISHIKEYIKDAGGLFPHVTVLADEIENNDSKPAIIHIPIPDDLMRDEESKDIFVDDILPDIMENIKQKFKPHAIAWASEAWMRKADKDFDFEKQDYKKLPKMEVIFVSIETKDKAETYLYEMNKVGMKVNEDGLCDDIQLTELEDLRDANRTEGRFAGLYKKLIND